MSDQHSVQSPPSRDTASRVEKGGVDYVPVEEQRSPPREVGIVFFGAQMCFGIIVLGALPILFGLGWWAAFTAITVGTAVGSVLFALMALVGPRTGTNSAASGGAFFGVVGRIIGSLIVLFIAIGFYALAVWTGAQAMVAGAHRLFGLPKGTSELAVAYAIIGALTIVVALVGHAMVVKAQNLIAPVVAVLLIVGIVIKFPDFRAEYAGSQLILDSFWPTWLLAAVTACALPLSYGPFVNDYARYVPGRHARRGSVMGGIGVFFGCWFALSFAAYFTTLFADPSVEFVFGVVGVSPTWYAIPLVIVGLVGSWGQGAIALYGAGLDAAALIRNLGRVGSTVLLALIGVALVYVGSLVLNAIDLVAAFTTLLTVLTAPWLVIIVMGHLAIKGDYVRRDLQVFTGGGKGGTYWYSRGWNGYALTAWLLSVIVGLLLSNTPPILQGPWRNMAGGVDLSFATSAVLCFVIYGSFLIFLPRHVLPKPTESSMPTARGIPAQSLTTAPAGTDERSPT